MPVRNDGNNKVWRGTDQIARLAWLTLALALLCATPLRADNPPPAGNAHRYPLSQAEFVSRYPEPVHNPPPSLEQLIRTRVYDFDTSLGLIEDTFTLFTVDDVGNHVPELQQYVFLTGRKLENGDYHLVVGIDFAPELYDLMFYVRYHDENWHPVICEPGSAFGMKGDRLFFSKLDVPGVVLCSVARIRPDVEGGTKFQEGVVCEFVFQPRPCDHKPHYMDIALEGKANQPAGLSVYQDPEACCPVLYWREVNQGDLNNDGVVNLTDIVPVARNYGQLSTDGFDDDWDWPADGNQDGEVNYRDTFVVENNYGAQLDGYRIYRRPMGSPVREEVLLPHNSFGLLPMSIHRPTAWRPNVVNEYRYFDRNLPHDTSVTEWTYRVVPYNATDDLEGNGCDAEISIGLKRDLLKVF